MADITRLPTPARPESREHQGLTSGHRLLIATIQDLCLDISLRSQTHAAFYNYDGNVHSLSVSVIPRALMSVAQGGDESFFEEWREYIYLPGGGNYLHRRRKATMQQLGTLVEKLEGYLPRPGGAA